MESQEKVWNKIAPEWHEFKIRPSEAATEFINKSKGKILDFGSGSGRNLLKLKKSKSRELFLVDFSKEMKTDFLKIMLDLEENMTEIMKAYYKNDSQLAHAVHEKKRENVLLCEDFYLSHHKSRWSGYLVNHMKSLSIGIHNIGRSVYQY